MAASPQDSEQFDLDLSLSVLLKPIRIVYRPTEVQKLTNFFHVDNIKDETKFKARQQLDSLRQTLSQHQKNLLLQASKKMNQVLLKIEGPVLELPFSNNPAHLEDLAALGMSPLNEEKWSFAMGTLTVSNFEA